MIPTDRAAGVHVAMLLGATAALYAVSSIVLMAPCWALFGVVTLVAWPIWLHQREYALFERRAILAGVTREASRIRRWFWSGQVLRVLHVFTAMFWAALLLAIASRMGPWHWGVVALDAAVLALLVRPITARLASEVREEQLGMSARRWPLPMANLAILAVAFFAADFLVVGAPDTRGLAWHQVAERTFALSRDGAACFAAGALVGALAVADALAWHAAEILIPSLPNSSLKLAAWAVFLLKAGVVAWALTRLHLGLVKAVDRKAAPAESSHAFLVTAGGMLALLFLLAQGMRDFDASSLAARGRQAIAWANPCRTDVQTASALRIRLDLELQALRKDEVRRANADIDAALDALFAQSESHVDDYLDWYFTVVGEYQRLGALVAGRFAESMREELEQRVFGEGFSDRLEQSSRAIADASQARLSAAAARLGGQVSSSVQAKPCLMEHVNLAALSSIERDALRASAAAGGGAAVAIAARLLARRAAATATAKAASRRVFQGAASLAGRAVTKRGGSTLIAAAGGAALCGPLAPLCALIAGGVTWIALDKAFITIDELRFRAEMRSEILETLAAQKAELAGELRGLHGAAIDRSVSGMQEAVQRAFVPVREGLR